MAEVVHHEGNGGNSIGFVMGIILLIAAIFLIAYFLLPALRGGGGYMPSGPGVNLGPK